jgi:DNA helicase HerA-like ATPase
LAEVAEAAIRNNNQADLQQLDTWGWAGVTSYQGTDARTLEGIKKRTLRAAAVFARMEQTNRKIANSADPLPTDRRELVRYGGISIVALAGYTGDFQATIYTLVADAIFGARVSGDLKLPVVLILEEAHNFVPPRANTPAEERSITITKQIAQEGRKFGVGLVLISQRPSRLDETTLSQCNSYVIMRMVNPADQNFVKRVVETIGEDEAKLLPDLDVGEAVLSGQFINFPVLAKIKPPESKGEHEEEDAFAYLDQCRKNLAAGGK